MTITVKDRLGEASVRRTLQDYRGKEYKGKFFRGFRSNHELCEITDFVGSQGSQQVSYRLHYLDIDNQYHVKEGCSMPSEQMARIGFEASPIEVEALKSGKEMPSLWKKVEHKHVNYDLRQN